MKKDFYMTCMIKTVIEMQYLKIPKERISILVGVKGEVKREIEKKTGIELRIDSEEGTVDIDESSAIDPVYALKVRDVVKAIARGFNPKTAMEIVDNDLYFSLIDIREYTGKKPKRIREMKGRLIGKEGKTKRIIQDLGNCSISIYGHTVGIIADAEDLDCARNAIDMILSGSKHASVHGYLERKRRESKTRKIDYMYAVETVDELIDEDILSESTD